MMDMHRELDRVLEGLTAREGVVGVALVSRDGLSVKSAGRPEMSRETFSAMSATLMGAAEIALGEFDGGATRSIVASTDRVRLVLLSSTRDLLLVATLTSAAPVDALLPELEAAARRVAATVGR